MKFREWLKNEHRLDFKRGRKMENINDNELGFSESFDDDDNIGNFIKYKAKATGISISEAAERSLGRIRAHVEGDKTIVIITAFRSERSLKENRNLNRLLASDIRSLNWGYIPVLGGFIEDTAEGKKRVQEESFFVSIPSELGNVTPKVLELLNKYQQEAALLKFSNEDAYLLFSDGNKTPVGKWYPDPAQIAPYYTLMRNGPRNRQFKFEATGDDSVVTRWAVYSYLNKNNV